MIYRLRFLRICRTVSYFIRLKDKNMERYIYVQLIILGNPFTYEPSITPTP